MTHGSLPFTMPNNSARPLGLHPFGRIKSHSLDILRHFISAISNLLCTLRSLLSFLNSFFGSRQCPPQKSMDALFVHSFIHSINIKHPLWRAPIGAESSPMRCAYDVAQMQWGLREATQSSCPHSGISQGPHHQVLTRLSDSMSTPEPSPPASLVYSPCPACSGPWLAP